MVRAILGGHKTQTRRIVAKSRSAVGSGRWEDLDFSSPITWTDGDATGPGCAEYLHVPTATGDGCIHRVYSRTSCGDRLWVRETWMETMPPGMAWKYRADRDRPEWAGLWRPSIHMPRAASRLALAVESVRVERLQAITEEDAYAEGVAGTLPEDTADSARDEFRILWDTISGRRATWDSDPWVWVVGFSVVPA